MSLQYLSAVRGCLQLGRDGLEHFLLVYPVLQLLAEGEGGAEEEQEEREGQESSHGGITAGC